MVSAIIVAAGKGLRMNHAEALPKQYLRVAGRPILAYSLMVFDNCGRIDQIVLVVPETDFEFCASSVIEPLNLKKKIRLVRGGAERQDSVYNGLRALDPKTVTVVIHDGVRPFIQVENITACILGAQTYGACILGLPAGDTVKQVKKADFIEKTLTRESVWLAQTPQAFAYDLIIKAHESAQSTGYEGTDDALLVERLGIDVKIIKGSKKNIKITNPEDLEMARALLGSG